MVVSEEEMGGIDRTEVQTGVGVGGTCWREWDCQDSGCIGGRSGWNLHDRGSDWDRSVGVGGTCWRKWDC